VEWPWLQDLIDGTIGKDDDSEDSEDDGDTDDGGAAADDDDGGGDERAADAENEGDTEALARRESIPTGSISSI